MTIPAKKFVAVNPAVLAAGGTALDLNGLVLTDSTRAPIGAVLSFPTATAVGEYFGPSSDEAAYANVYFRGFDNSSLKPGALLFAQYPLANVPAYLRGGSMADVTLADLQDFAAGTIIVTINGIVHTSASIDLSDATSFSNAAAQITTGLAANDVAFTGAITGATMTVSAVSAGALAVGQIIAGAGVTAGTVITALGTGTGGTGTYTVSPAAGSPITAESMTGGAATVTYDSQSQAFVITGGTPGSTATIGYASGTLAADVKLTAATGAVLSQGAATGVPATNMAAIVLVEQNFATFTTIWEPNTDTKVDFAAWANAQDDGFLYVMWDTSAAPTTSSDTTSAGYLIRQADYAGVALLYEPSDQYLAPFVMGAVASINFGETEGRTSLAYRSQSGLTPGVTNETIADNLEANGYSYYAAVATRNDGFEFFYPGSVTGDFLWIDSYVNQIQLNNALQLAILVLLTQAKSIPYNAAGYAKIEAACADPINLALNFGSIRAGVVLSASQIADVNAAAGLNIATTLQQRGWYLQVKDPGAQARQNRESPICKFWYVDGQSVQQITLSSTEIQ